MREPLIRRMTLTNEKLNSHLSREGTNATDRKSIDRTPTYHSTTSIQWRTSPIPIPNLAWERSITGMWWTIPRERALKWTISSTGLTLQVKFDELLADLCLLSTKCVLGKESKLSSSHSVRWPRKLKEYRKVITETSYRFATWKRG